MKKKGQSWAVKVAKQSLQINWNRSNKKELKKLMSHFRVVMALDLYELGEMDLTRKQRMKYLAETTYDNLDVYVKMNELDENRKNNMARNRERERTKRKGK